MNSVLISAGPKGRWKVAGGVNHRSMAMFPGAPAGAAEVAADALQRHCRRSHDTEQINRTVSVVTNSVAPAGAPGSAWTTTGGCTTGYIPSARRAGDSGKFVPTSRREDDGIHPKQPLS